MIDPLLEGLADPDPERRRRAIFGVLSHRRHDLLTPLYDLALAEKEAGLAVLATQVVLSLRSAPPDPRQDELIERAVADRDPDRLDEASWEYLETAGTRLQRLHVLALLSRHDAPPRHARGFLESCIGHCDPDVRTAACRPAVAAGNGRLLAWVLAAIEDPDAGVGREAVAAIQTAPRALIADALEEALTDADEWVPACVAEFLPVLAGEEMRESLLRGGESALPRVAARSREALARLDARKMASRLPPPPPLPKPIERPADVKFSFPSPMPVATKPAVAAPPPGPLPWAHLVTALASAPETIPAAGPEIAPPTPPPARETPKKERVISMRSRITKDKHEKPAAVMEKPFASAMADGGARLVSRPQAGEVSLATPRPPGDALSSVDISADTPGQLDLDVWEAVSIDFAAPREPRLAVQIEPAGEPPVGMSVSDTADIEITIDDAHVAQTAPLSEASEAPEQSRDGALSLAKPPMIDTILARYPSFVTGPLERFFRPAAPDALMETLRAAIEPLIAFLSFAFLQTYLFFGRRTPKGDQAARDALNAHFSGPASVRLLHHLSLSVREIEGDAFFSTGLARAMNEASEDMNPLFMLREVTEFLKTPPDEAGDGLQQVAGGLPALLGACKGILQNPIVLKLPPGAREPFLNLSGPRPLPLSAADRPGLDLPANEIVVLSKDRSEALGLFPYFTFDGRSVTFGIPADAAFKTLLERLGLTL
ncbi:MAG TPA: hypothetical protein PLU72_17680 [Candidatus Ozemobacteraceae bacterium]|nr:hypothetical protein [Candidatus Ozemobacteraceae bacterium]